MRYLEWKQQGKGSLEFELMAFGRAAEPIKEKLTPANQDEVEVDVFTMRKWVYTHAMELYISSRLYPLNNLLPTFQVYVDGTAVGGRTLMLPGHWDMPVLGESTYTGCVVFYFPNFFNLKGVNLTELLLLLPSTAHTYRKQIRSEIYG